MRVLVACEYSGTVRDAFTSRGHMAISCDILPTETPGPHYQGNVLDIINDGWDLMIAFPPCTHLANAGGAWFEQKRRDGRQQQGIDFFMAMINAPINKIAVENPQGIMSTVYRKPDQIIQPYYFGDPKKKATCLWLKNLPKLWHVKEDTLFDKKTVVEPEGPTFISIRKNGRKRYGSWLDMVPKKDRWKIKSKTFTGIASAMAEQWG